MRIAIDALNIRAGGGLTHLREFMAAIPATARKVEVTVFATRGTAATLPAHPWLSVVVPPGWARGPLGFYVWRPWRLDTLLGRLRPDVFFVPGGVYLGPFRPFVTMAQNLLPFEPRERAREGHGFKRVRLHLLEWLQALTFRQAAKVIYVSKFSQNSIEKRIGGISDSSVMVYHGINPRFNLAGLSQSPRNDRVPGAFRWLYVSNIDAYKNQTTVAKAAGNLISEGQKFTLDFIGPGESSAVRELRRAIAAADSSGQQLRYLGRLDYESMEMAYRAADAFIFASSCETFGMIVLEAMAAGLPIASSRCSAIPEIVGDAGVFFDPESPASIADAMRRIMSDEVLRRDLAERAQQQAAKFSWEKCARETLAVLEAAIASSPGKQSSRAKPKHMSTSSTPTPEPTGAQARELFDSIATEWEDKYEEDGSMSHRRERFCDVLRKQVPQKGRLLDFGCASGDLSSTFSRAGYRVSGVDQAPAMIARASARFGPAGIDFKLLRPEETGVVLPFGEGEFAAIVASSVAEYLVPISAYLQEWHRVSAPGATLLVTVPNPLHPLRWLESFEILLSRFSRKPIEQQSDRARYLKTSVNRSGSATWRKLLADSGWTWLHAKGWLHPLLLVVAQKAPVKLRS